LARRAQLVDLYENDCIFDKFDCCFNGRGDQVRRPAPALPGGAARAARAPPGSQVPFSGFYTKCCWWLDEKGAEHARGGLVERAPEGQAAAMASTWAPVLSASTPATRLAALTG